MHHRMLIYWTNSTEQLQFDPAISTSFEIILDMSSLCHAVGDITINAHGHPDVFVHLKQ